MVALLPLMFAGIAQGTPRALSAQPPRSAAGNRVVQIPVSFRVRNVNRSKVACPADGRTYTERGDLVAPAGDLTGRAKTVTLYLHGLGLGKFFWRFRAVAGYDYAAALVRAGQAAVVVDRLGYHASGKPPGKKLCLGSQADIANQEVADLRDGRYRLTGHHPPRFRRVVLAGHSFGGLIAQIEAYSFGNISGLIVMSYGDAGNLGSEQAARRPVDAPVHDNRGTASHHARPGTESLGYEPYGPAPVVRKAFFHNVSRQSSGPPSPSSTMTRAATPSPSRRR